MQPLSLAPLMPTVVFTLTVLPIFGTAGENVAVPARALHVGVAAAAQPDQTIFALVGLLLARWPLWLMGTFVLERILGCRGLGSDWMVRVLLRDAWGMTLWLVALAGLWSLGCLGRRRCA